MYPGYTSFCIHVKKNEPTSFSNGEPNQQITFILDTQRQPMIEDESLCSPVAQSVERVTVNHHVRGSSPRWGAKRDAQQILLLSSI